MLDLIGFFTRIPIGKTSIEQAAKYSFLLPLLGAFIGLIVGIFSYLSFKYMYDFLAALITIVILYLITGLNHLDGLADFADGLYTSGTKKRKIKAMKDVKIGIAGVSFVLFTFIFLIYSVFLLNGDIYRIVVAEICAKSAMLSALLISKPLGSGIGRLFIENKNKVAYPFSILFTIIISYILLGFLGVSAIIISIVVSILMVFIATRVFGGVNGDVVGAINEISRIVCMFTLLLNVR